MARLAAAVGHAARRRKPGWPTLWLFTDPERTPDLLAAARRLPEGSGVVLRTFGRPALEAQGLALRSLAHERRLVLLVGADARLAQRIDADGLHLPERMAATLPRLRARHPLWRLTLAAHTPLALHRAAAAGADAAFLSPVLPSRSPSAGAPLGPVRTAAWVREAALPVYGLGGVDARTAPRLIGSGLAGLAGVGFAAGGG